MFVGSGVELSRFLRNLDDFLESSWILGDAAKLSFEDDRFRGTRSCGARNPLTLSVLGLVFGYIKSNLIGLYY